jgi:hypothetical protein
MTPQGTISSKSLPNFESASNAVARLPHFNERFGMESNDRVTLQVVYEYFDRASSVGLDDDAFNEAFQAFTSELAKPTWRLVMVSNLRHFESPDALIDFGDGMTIRHRSFEELRARLGWRDATLNTLTRDWMEGWGAGKHILWIEEEIEKTPETLVLGNTPTGYTILSRLLLALWLYREGDLSLGTVFNAESASFSLRGGPAQSGRPASNPFGKPYNLRASDASEVRMLYDDVARFDADPTVPNNVRLAFRSFASIYARDSRQREDRILDSITALEALLGAKEELAFKLSFRVASILAASDHDRAILLAEMKRFYTTRSTIVHGGELRQQHLDLINDDTALRDVVRRVLRAVLHLAVEHEKHLTRKFVANDLDGILVHSEEREALRREMALRG